jgi:TonB family protein
VFAISPLTRNRKKNSTTILIATVFLIPMILVSALSSERLKKERPSAANKPSLTAKSGYLSAPFDPDIQEIPVPYLGHDIERLYLTLENRTRTQQKDEFETTEQYRLRLAKADRPLFGSVNRDAVLVFVATPDITYDADTRTVTVVFETLEVDYDRKRFGILIRNRDLIRKKVLGQNAFGAKFEFERILTEQFGLAIHNLSSFQTENVNPYSLGATIQPLKIKGPAVVQRITLEPEQARAIKNKITGLILAKLTPPYVSNNTVHEEATIRSPWEFFQKEYDVDVDLHQIWLFNKTTGEVMAKVSPSVVAPAVATPTLDTPPEQPPNSRHSTKVSSAQLILSTKPVYPPKAKQARIQGVVVLEIEVDKEGNVRNPTVISGHPLLLQGALDGVREWKYKPLTLNGEPSDCKLQVIVNFNLSSD